MNCPYCNEEIKKEQLRYMLAIESPYLNSYFHRECYNLIKDDILAWLNENDNLKKLVDIFHKRK